jgi:hypothetical protein
MTQKNPQEPDFAREQAWREEAECLAILPIADQEVILALHRSVAEDSKVSKANRQEARERLEALERFLKLKPKKKRRPS